MTCVCSVAANFENLQYLITHTVCVFLRVHGTARSWLGWLVFDVLLWPLTIFGGPGAAFAKLRGTVDGLRGHAASAPDVARYLG